MSAFEDFAMKNFLIYGKDFVRLYDLKKFYEEYQATKHALWMARAMRAEGMLRFFSLARMWCNANKWKWVESKCLQKAKEYE